MIGGMQSFLLVSTPIETDGLAARTSRTISVHRRLRLGVWLQSPQFAVARIVAEFGGMPCKLLTPLLHGRVGVAVVGLVVAQVLEHTVDGIDHALGRSIALGQTVLVDAGQLCQTRSKTSATPPRQP